MTKEQLLEEAKLRYSEDTIYEPITSADGIIMGVENQKVRIADQIKQEADNRMHFPQHPGQIYAKGKWARVVTPGKYTQLTFQIF